MDMANASGLNISIFVRFDIFLRFKMASIMVTSLHIRSLYRLNCLIQYKRKRGSSDGPYEKDFKMLNKSNQKSTLLHNENIVQSSATKTSRDSTN